MNRKVIIFAYYWPPAGGVAVQRYLKFTKYLHLYGWDPIIVTPREGAYPFRDESLAEQIPANVEVHHTHTFEPFELYNLLMGKKGKAAGQAIGTGTNKSLFQKFSEYIRANYFIPDARKGWVPYAVKEAKKIMAQHKIDAIITTSPPHSAHLIGLELKKKFGTPWVADFRDPWSKVFYNNFLPRTAASNRKDHELEARVLNNADKIVLISKGMSEEFGTAIKDPVVIYNGFDESDYNQQPLETEGFFTLRYIGNFFATENPPGLWKALKGLIEEDQDFAQYFRFELTGNVDPVIRSQISNYQLDKWVQISGFVPHKTAIRLMQGGNLLLLCFSNVPGNAAHMTGKVFEYLPTQNPILGYGNTGGEATQLLQQISREPLLDYEDEAGTKAFIQKYFALWMQEKKRFQYSDKKYLSLSRKLLTQQLADTLNSITL